MGHNNIVGSVIAGRDVKDSNNGNKNVVDNSSHIIRQARIESAIISFVVGILSSIVASLLLQ